MKVGICIPYITNRNNVKLGYYAKGDAVFIDEIILGLIEQGHASQMVIFCSNYCNSFFSKRYSGVQVVSVGPWWFQLLQRITKKNCAPIGNRFHFIEKIIDKYDLTMLWDPYASREYSIKVPVYYTVHDLIDYHNKRDNSPMKNVLLSSNNIITISNYVKEDILKSIPEIRGEIEVIPNPICLHNYEEKKVATPNKYILDVNGYREHKNTLTLIRAFNLIKDKTECDLILVGSDIQPKYKTEIDDYINKNNIGDRVKCFRNISWEELEFLYNHATLFVNPSTKEGFGRTPVEAAMHNIPVITSKETSLFEVTKGKLEYFNNPFDEYELSEKILHVLVNGVNYNILEVSELFKKEYSPLNVTSKYWNIFCS